MRRGAAIDLGSNTTLFLLGEVEGGGGINIIDEASVSNGLGEDVFRSGEISPGTIERNIEILRELMLRATAGGAEKTVTAGTAALRKAANRGEFVKIVEDELGLEVKILPEGDEARLSYLGYLSGRAAFRGRVMLVDIGGGSTEFTIARDESIEHSFSLDIGAVRLMEIFPPGAPPDLKNYLSMREYTEVELARVGEKQLVPSWEEIVLSGGTAAALAALKCDVSHYNGDTIEGIRLNREWIARTQDRFLESTLEARKRILHFDPDRAKVIIGGTVIALEIMKRFSIDQCRVTHRGLRFGLLAEMFVEP